MKTSVVLGLGFGDEGKGLTTSYLVNQSSYRPDSILVTRFQGGHQAGHTVVHEGKRHVFSSFGSGTLQGCDTYWTKHCTFYPIAFCNEHKALKGPDTLYLIDAMAPIVTPYDVSYNQDTEKQNQHGSVGVGFGTTIQRQEDHYKLHFVDLLYDRVFRQKLSEIIWYYRNTHVMQEVLDDFMESVATIRQLVREKQIIVITQTNHTDKIFSKYKEIIFEGAQGILLDMDCGFFPNVTRSNTTSKNVGLVLKDLGLPVDGFTAIWYVTRSYQTRHGNGFMTNEGMEHIAKPNALETNMTNRYQGKFRKGILDLNLINYAIACDRSVGIPGYTNLMLTCLDQTDEEIRFTIGERNDLGYVSPAEFKTRLDHRIHNWHACYGDSYTDVR